MKKGRFFVLGMLVVVLSFGIISLGCDNGTSSDAFVPVTNITDVPTIGIVNNDLTLHGRVEPPNATNRTIAWSGAGVSNGVLTATSAGTLSVTATIANGTSGSSPYTQSFEITIYDAGTSDVQNPFGNDTSPYIWAMDNRGGNVYVTIKNDSWVATADGTTYNRGTYNRIGGRAAGWTVTGGSSTGNTGLAVIDNGTMTVANFTNEYSSMNGTFTKLNTGLTLDGTWKTSETSNDGYYMKIVAGSGNFTASISSDDSSWRELIKGTYPNTNPAACEITHVNTGALTGGADNSVAWDSLDQQHKNMVGGSQTFTMIIYSTKCEGMELVFQKQP
jgi:hypothetical protein